MNEGNGTPKPGHKWHPERGCGSGLWASGVLSEVYDDDNAGKIKLRTSSDNQWNSPERMR
jgi:hypothetical protein